MAAGKWIKNLRSIFIHLVDQREDRAVFPNHEDLDENDLDGADAAAHAARAGAVQGVVQSASGARGARSPHAPRENGRA